jgi:predicted secreted hydrolase
VLGQAGRSAAWKRADPSYRIALPRDHASHPDYKIEWWYYTGNLSAAAGRRFGYQLTFFRVGVDPAPANPSRWAVRDLFMAHVAVTDVAARRHHAADLVNRGGAGWAGASTDTYRVWNEDWSAIRDPEGRHVLRAATPADRGSFEIDLVLDEGKPFVAHGEQGYSRKGSEPGNASTYYSLTRMPTRGTIVVGGERFPVEGLSWMDHEFGTSFLEAGQVGWDWFSIQLDDGTDLMLFQMRRGDGRADPHSSGTWVGADGRAEAMGAVEFVLRAGQEWTSPASGASYPIWWSVSIPGRGTRLEVRAAVAAQELLTERSTGVTYWEGAIDVRGTRDGREVRGRGYLEMTGYAGVPMSEKFR